MQGPDPKDCILGHICKVLNQGVDADALLAMPLDEVGLDSLERMELLNDIEDEYQIRFDDQAFGDGKTVQDLVAYVSSMASSKS